MSSFGESDESLTALAVDSEIAHSPAVVERAGQHTLADLRVGERAVVRAVRCPRPVAVRLMEMGLLPGTPVELVRVAPFGDPIELRLRGYALSIRRAEASAIEIERLEPERKA